jgi:hypothetical protein
MWDKPGQEDFWQTNHYSNPAIDGLFSANFGKGHQMPSMATLCNLATSSWLDFAQCVQKHWQTAVRFVQARFQEPV